MVCSYANIAYLFCLRCKSFSRFYSFSKVANIFRCVWLANSSITFGYNIYFCCMYVRFEYLTYALNLITTPLIDSTSVYLGGKQNKNVCWINCYWCAGNEHKLQNFNYLTARKGYQPHVSFCWISLQFKLNLVLTTISNINSTDFNFKHGDDKFYW